jgi:DNA topoisomerase-3
MFRATGRQVLASGWKSLVAEAPRDDTTSDDGLRPDHDSAPPLPHLARGDAVTAHGVAVGDKKTQPPKAFTDSSLIAAMCAVAKFVSSPHIKKILSESDGIGTPATRAAIIETLFERGYVSRDKKTIVSTETGRALIGCLPEVATTPDMTAVWEAAMRAITDGSQSLDAFLARVGSELAALVAQGRALGRITVPAGSASSRRPTPPARTARPSRASRAPARSPSVR